MLRVEFPVSRSSGIGLLSPKGDVYGCQNKSYEEVISRAHVITISGEQISESLNSIVVAIFLGTVVILLSLLAIRRSAPKL